MRSRKRGSTKANSTVAWPLSAHRLVKPAGIVTYSTADRTVLSALNHGSERQVLPASEEPPRERGNQVKVSGHCDRVRGVRRPLDVERDVGVLDLDEGEDVRVGRALDHGLHRGVARA